MVHDKRNLHLKDELTEPANDAHEQDEHEQVEFEQEKDVGVPKDKLVLGYMLEHNRQHAKELVDLAIKMENRGLNDTATIILNAVYDYERGNDKLEAALETI